MLWRSPTPGGQGTPEWNNHIARAQHKEAHMWGGLQGGKQVVPTRCSGPLGILPTVFWLINGRGSSLNATFQTLPVWNIRLVETLCWLPGPSGVRLCAHALLPRAIRHHETVCARFWHFPLIAFPSIPNENGSEFQKKKSEETPAEGASVSSGLYTYLYFRFAHESGSGLVFDDKINVHWDTWNRAFYKKGQDKQSRGDSAVSAKCVMSGADYHQSREEATAVRDEDTRDRTKEKKRKEKKVRPGIGN